MNSSKPPPAQCQEDDAISIKLPIPPAAVRRIRKHVEGVSKVTELFGAVLGAVVELDRDLETVVETVKKVRKGRGKKP